MKIARFGFENGVVPSEVFILGGRIQALSGRLGDTSRALISNVADSRLPTITQSAGVQLTAYSGNTTSDYYNFSKEAVVGSGGMTVTHVRINSRTAGYNKQATMYKVKPITPTDTFDQAIATGSMNYTIIPTTPKYDCYINEWTDIKLTTPVVLLEHETIAVRLPASTYIGTLAKTGSTRYHSSGAYSNTTVTTIANSEVAIVLLNKTDGVLSLPAGTSKSSVRVRTPNPAADVLGSYYMQSKGVTYPSTLVSTTNNGVSSTISLQGPNKVRFSTNGTDEDTYISGMTSPLVRKVEPAYTTALQGYGYSAGMSLVALSSRSGSATYTVVSVDSANRITELDKTSEDLPGKLAGDTLAVTTGPFGKTSTESFTVTSATIVAPTNMYNFNLDNEGYKNYTTQGTPAILTYNYDNPVLFDGLVGIPHASTADNMFILYIRSADTAAGLLDNALYEEHVTNTLISTVDLNLVFTSTTSRKHWSVSFDGEVGSIKHLYFKHLMFTENNTENTTYGIPITLDTLQGYDPYSWVPVKFSMSRVATGTNAMMLDLAGTVVTTTVAFPASGRSETNSIEISSTLGDVSLLDDIAVNDSTSSLDNTVPAMTYSTQSSLDGDGTNPTTWNDSTGPAVLSTIYPLRFTSSVGQVIYMHEDTATLYYTTSNASTIHACDFIGRKTNVSYSGMPRKHDRIVSTISGSSYSTNMVFVSSIQKLVYRAGSTLYTIDPHTDETLVMDVGFLAYTYGKLTYVPSINRLIVSGTNNKVHFVNPETLQYTTVGTALPCMHSLFVPSNNKIWLFMSYRGTSTSSYIAASTTINDKVAIVSATDLSTVEYIANNIPSMGISYSSKNTYVPVYLPSIDAVCVPHKDTSSYIYSTFNVRLKYYRATTNGGGAIFTEDTSFATTCSPYEDITHSIIPSLGIWFRSSGAYNQLSSSDLSSTSNGVGYTSFKHNTLTSEVFSVSRSSAQGTTYTPYIQDNLSSTLTTGLWPSVSRLADIVSPYSPGYNSDVVGNVLSFKLKPNPIGVVTSYEGVNMQIIGANGDGSASLSSYNTEHASLSSPDNVAVKSVPPSNLGRNYTSSVLYKAGDVTKGVLDATYVNNVEMEVEVV